MNYIKQVAKMLNVKIGEELKLKWNIIQFGELYDKYQKGIYRFTEEEFQVKHDENSDWEHSALLQDVIYGQLVIVYNNKMNFGDAIKELKLGKKLQREGWNGKSQYIILGSNISYVLPDNTIVNSYHDQIGNKSIIFVGTSGVQVGWLASQADILAEDWRVVED